MRRWIAACAVALVGLLVLAVVLFGAALTPTPATAQRQDCQATLGPWPTDGGDGAADAARLSAESRQIVGQIIGIGQSRGLPPRAWQVAIQAGMTESGLRNLPYGDRDSLGIFQMRPSMGWGTPAQLQDIPYQITKFYDTLTTVAEWEAMRPGDAAQQVERSGFPDRYHRWEAMAAYLVATLGDVADPTGCGTGAPGDAAATAIEAAKRWLGTPYAWGGGGINGPTAGEGGVVGFDCSGLTLYAYHQAGITLPRVSWQQYTAGQHLPVDQAQPGDLLFWAHDPTNPASIHHVALYLGNNEVIHAPQRGDVVKISTVWEAGMVGTVIRPGA